MSVGATLVTYSKTERIVWTRGQGGVLRGTVTEDAYAERSGRPLEGACIDCGDPCASRSQRCRPCERLSRERTCVVCESPFVDDTSGHNRTYCSVDCRKVARREQRRAHDALKRRGRCADCGAPTSRDKEHPGEYAVRCADCHLHPRRRVS